MTFKPTGNHLIAGDWIGGGDTFMSEPSSGPAHAFSVGTEELIDKAILAAEEAFGSYGKTSRESRAKFLNAIADEIEARADAITEIGTQESGLPEARLQGERGRTSGQMRVFADHILKGDYLDVRHDEALPDRAPLPRPDLKMVQRPIGPVAVFGASNFPLAFSTAGGDTAAALAAGCPVVVKGHPAHPGTSEVVAEAVAAAVDKTSMPKGVFSLIQNGPISIGAHLVQHPLIKAVGFTGSLRAGRALFDLCAARPEPIPFFGELGSINPMFVLPNAARSRGAEIASGWAGSLTMGAGQFCTNPGVVVISQTDADDFLAHARAALADTTEQVMLTDGIAGAYRNGTQTIKDQKGVEEILGNSSAGRTALPNVFKTDLQTWLSNDALSEEVFGPLGIVVTTADIGEMLDFAKSLSGQLTATLHLDNADTEAAQSLLPTLERKAGRILANGFPTGVEVADSMVHGGPYPASTNFGATSVGTLAIRRFLRPVCYQNMPDGLVGNL